jgi:protein-S-isoprenylcysteine O-methyltransferase Ste14
MGHSGWRKWGNACLAVEFTWRGEWHPACNCDSAVNFSLAQNPRDRQDRRSGWAGFAFFLCWTGLNLVLTGGVFRNTPAVALLLVPTFVHELLIAVAFLLRRPLRNQAEGWAPSLSAYGATFLMPAFCFFAGRWQPAWIQSASASLVVPGFTLWMAGSCFGLWSLVRLRSAFSIVPQARALVTSGPYRVARHPLYSSYVLQYAGMLLSHPTVPLGLIYTVWCALVIVRVRYEEAVLLRAFPEYAIYRRQVGRFMPRLRSVAVHRPGKSVRPQAETAPRWARAQSGNE